MSILLLAQGNILSRSDKFKRVKCLSVLDYMGDSMTKQCTELKILGRDGHRVAMSVCVCVCLRHRVQFFSRPLIGPQIT